MGEQIARLPLELLKGVGMTGVQTVGGITALPYTGARALFPSLTPYEETGLGKAIASAEESLAPGYGNAAQVA